MRYPVLVLVLALVAAALIALGVWIITRIRRDPKDREKRRRLAIHAAGRIIDGSITEVSDTTVFYSYMVAGVQYAASQDIAGLGAPENPERLIGKPVTVKYARRNPANSIIVCEGWSGIRRRGE